MSAPPIPIGAPVHIRDQYYKALRLSLSTTRAPPIHMTPGMNGMGLLLTCTSSATARFATRYRQLPKCGTGITLS
jgi:hypothetical protein